MKRDTREWTALHRDAFLRFLGIADTAGAVFEGAGYDRLDDAGLKRLLNDYFSPLEGVFQETREEKAGRGRQKTPQVFQRKRILVSAQGYALARDDRPVFDRRNGLMQPHRALCLRLKMKTDIHVYDENGALLEAQDRSPVWVDAARIPCPDEEGVFLVRGQERVPIGHIARAPGVVFEQDGRGWLATLRPDEGAHLKFYLDRQKDRWGIALEAGGQKTPLDLAWLERLCEPADSGDWQAWEIDLDDRYRNLGRRVRAAFDPALVAANYDLSPGGRRRLNQALGLSETETRRLTPRDVLATLRRLLHAGGVTQEDAADEAVKSIFERAGQIGYEPVRVVPYDPYDLSGKRLLLIDDLLARAFRAALRGIQRKIRLLIPERGGEIRWQADVLTRNERGQTPVDREVEALFLRHSLVQIYDRLNPLADLSHRRKITYYAPNSRNEGRLPRGLRDIHESARGRVCPLETPQGPNIGLNLYLALGAGVDADGKLIAGDEMLGLSASLIPFIQHDDGTRGMMAANMMKQALPLVNPEPPLAQTGLEEEAARASGWGIYAEVDGPVTEVSPERIVAGGKVYPLVRWRERNPYQIHFCHTPLVREGDSVKTGQALADGPAMKGGCLALGRNLLVAVMPWKGFNFEDALVVSRRVVDEDLMTSEHLYTRREPIYGNECLTRDVEGIPETERARLDERGVIRVGEEVRPGDGLIALERRKEAQTKEAKLHRVEAGVRGTVVQASVVARAEVPVGTLEEKAGVVCQEAVVRILRRRRLAVGDKLANRHGNKGVVAAIVPPEEMPHLPDGTPVDLVMNPLGVISRMNVGQLLEAHWGAVLAHRKEPRIFPQFAPGDEAALREALRQAGLDENGKTCLRDGDSGPPFDHPVVVGWMYWMKLGHMSEDKMHARATGPYVLGTQQPPRGQGANGGQRLGEMEVWALEAHGASSVLQELLTVKSDDVVGRRLLNRRTLKGMSLKRETSVPHSFRAFISLMRGLALSVEVLDKNDQPLDLFGPKPMSPVPVEAVYGVRIRPALGADIVKWSKGEVGGREGMALGEDLFKRPFENEVEFLCACGCERGQRNYGRRCPVCKEEVRYRVRRADQDMGHLQLAVPVVHPAFASEVARLMEIADWQAKEEEKPAPDARPAGEQDPEPDTRSAGEKVQERLGRLDLNRMLAAVREAMRTETRKTYQNRYRAWYGLLRDLKQSGVDLQDSLVLTCLPILPVSLRPRPEGGAGRWHPLNERYRTVFRLNNRVLKCLRTDQKTEVPVAKTLAVAFAADLEQAMGQLFDAIWEMVEGKEGHLRRHLLGKRADFSGRIVVAPDPRLRMDQCGIPLAFAAALFEPFLIRRLGGEIPGFGSTNGRAYIRETLKTDAGRKRLWRLLDDLMRDRVILLNRFPTLHRMNIQAFYPVLRDTPGHDTFVMTIHPLICAGYNADFDGDQFSIHLPVSEAARQEAARLCLSTAQVISPANGSLSPVNLAQDIVMGVFYLTAYEEEKAAGRETEALLKRHMDGEAGIWDHLVEKILRDREYHCRTDTGGEATTVGRALLSGLFGVRVQGPVDKKGLRGMAEVYCKTHIRSDTIECFQKLMRLGFRAATQAGVSLGIFDLPALDVREKAALLEQADQRAEAVRAAFPDEECEEHRKGVIRAWEAALGEAGDRLMARLPDTYDPVAVMVRSSARGDRASLAQMGAFRGLMGRSGGGYILPPVDACFREGLIPDQFFTSSYGFRKGGVGKALSTSDAGYVTRKLVECCQWIRVVKAEDCGDEEGIALRSIRGEKGKEVLSFRSRLVGRILMADLKQEEGSVRRKAGEAIEEGDLEYVTEQTRVRSPLSCRCVDGLCAACYGLDLSTGKPAGVGHAAGVIAGQSLGEPTTQLALRAFHAGGIARLDLVDALGEVVALLELQGDRLAKAEAELRRRLEETGSVRMRKEMEDKRPLQQYLADELQRIYSASGQDVRDIHFEVVVRGMFREVEVKDEVETEAGVVWLPGERLSLERAEREGVSPDRRKPVALGIRALAQTREGFLAAASFEQTRATLRRAALRGAIDRLRSMKERVILGQSIRMEG